MTVSTWAPWGDGGVFVQDTVIPRVGRLRSTAIRLRDGRFAVYSPLAAAKEADDAQLPGAVAFLVAPNHFHHLGIPRWQRRHPDAVAVCADVATKRLARQCPAPMAPFDALRAALPDHVSLLEVDGTRSGETWLRVQGQGVAWCVADGIFAFESVPAGMGVLFWLMGLKPGLHIGGTFRVLQLRDRAACQRWLMAQLERDRPTALIPAHGAIHEGAELADTLLALARTRLG